MNANFGCTRIFAATALALVAVALSAPAQEQRLTVRITPSQLQLKVGAEAQLKAEVFDANGNPVEANVLFFSRDRRSLQVRPDGTMLAISPGEYEVVARVATPADAGARRIRDAAGVPSGTVIITVPQPTLTSIEFTNLPDTVYVGTHKPLVTRIVDETGNERTNVEVVFTSSEPVIAAVDAFGQLTGSAPGRGTITAQAEGVSVSKDIEVAANPLRSIELTADLEQPRTGDVVHFTTVGVDGSGNPVAGVPIHLSLEARHSENAAPSMGQIEQDGRFVAEQPGLYTIVATSGSVSTRNTVRAVPRDIKMHVEVVGLALVSETNTSDLWVWEGVDGRDYAVTGTHGVSADAGFEDGAKAFFWDVTDPSNMKRIGEVQVDARTVNDVKVSEDGRVCIISREGASNRRNGIVLVDVEDPSNPTIIAAFDEELTGGVHNVFVHDNHVYALSAGQRYDVINIEDPKNPYKVGNYQVDLPGSSIHDVWVEAGIAYSSNWGHGVHVVDVGNGVAGGRPDSPVLMSSYVPQGGRNHAAFPLMSQTADRFYVIAGDETFPSGMNQTDLSYAAGYMHIIDFTDLENPAEVARYEVPEAGTHNLWIEDEILYAAYYNGGVRIVDVSGELMGDLYRQGREIASFRPAHPDGYVPNAPFTWGPQPYKGNIFLSDMNSGMWCIKLVPVPDSRR